MSAFGLAVGAAAAPTAAIAPARHHVESISGLQNFASNRAGIVIATFTGVMVSLTKGSFTIELLVAGGFCFLGAFSYLVVVDPIEPLLTAPDEHQSRGRHARRVDRPVHPDLRFGRSEFAAALPAV